MTARPDSDGKPAPAEDASQDAEGLLLQVLDMLDSEGADIAAIHVSAAIHALQNHRAQGKPSAH
jgi:hypothetical protein